MKTLQDHYDSFLSMIDPTQLSNIVAYLKNPDSDIKAVMEVADRATSHSVRRGFSRCILRP